MRRLLRYFDRVFDPYFPVGGTPLGDLVTQVLDDVVIEDMPEFGTAGEAKAVACESGRFVQFFYRPHLFPGMDDDLRRAHQLQFHLLPREMPAGAPVSVAAVLESYCHLSGDLFGWEKLPEGKFLTWIADMAGHGVEAGLCAAVLKILIDRAPERSRVERMVEEVSNSLNACLRDRYSSLFATGFFAIVDDRGEGSYCSAGHPPVLLRRAAGEIEELTSTSRPIGLIPGSTHPARQLRVGAGDALLLYTDGLVETTDREGEPFGLDRVRRLFAAGSETPEAMTGSIYGEVSSRHDLRQLDDDVTFVVARFG